MSLINFCQNMLQMWLLNSKHWTIEFITSCAVVGYCGWCRLSSRGRIYAKLEHDIASDIRKLRISIQIWLNCLLYAFTQWPNCVKWICKHQIKSFVILAVKRVMSWWGPSSRHCAWATRLLSKNCRSGSEPLATLHLIWPVRNLNVRPPTSEANTLMLDHLANFCKYVVVNCQMNNLNAPRSNFFSQTFYIWLYAFNI